MYVIWGVRGGEVNEDRRKEKLHFKCGEMYVRPSLHLC